MKILIISPEPTHPPTAGNRARMCSMSRTLMDAGHEVHFALVPMCRGDEEAMRRHFAGRYHELPYRGYLKVVGGVSLIFRKALKTCRMARAFSWGIDDWYDPQTSGPLGKLQEEHGFEAVIVEYVFLSRCFSCFGPEVLKLIDTHDRFADRHLMYLKAGKRPEWFSTTVAQEALGLARADVVLAIQEDERRAFGELLGDKARVVEVGHLLLVAPPVEPVSEPNLLLFGSANSINVDGARYFCNEVMPRVLEAVPAARLLVAGRLSDALADSDYLEKLGVVDDLSALYSRAAVVVNPVRYGTGLNIKTIEALGYGAALVSTESGARGLAGTDCAFRVVPDDDPSRFASVVCETLRDAGLRNALSVAARKWALGWNEAQTQSLLGVLQIRSGI